MKNKSSGLFITGTDTDIGKTHVSLGLLAGLNSQGYSTVGIKPLASGCVQTPQGWQNNDALQLQNQASIRLPYTRVNPIRFNEPIAPHIAAEKNNSSLSVSQLYTACQPALEIETDYLLVEGVGGWLMPLNTHETMADLAKEFNFPLILVVGMRLGCLNHAILTTESILSCRLHLLGWVANQIDPGMDYVAENILMLQKRITAPLLGIIPYQANMAPTVTAEFLDLTAVTKLRC